MLCGVLGSRSTLAPVTDGPPLKPATGAITPENLGASPPLLPEQAIVVDGALKPVEASAAHSSLILTRRAAPLPL
jgi:hypothetical protein